MSSYETLVSRYKKKIENNKFFAILVAITLVITSITAAIAGAKAMYDLIIPRPQTFQESVEALAKKGCILFFPDSSAPVSKDSFIIDSYKHFWRESDIFYADSIEIQGFTHQRGGNAYNQRIGERKARAAKDFIIEHALVPEQTDITIISYGESRSLERAGEYECGALVKVSHKET